MLSDISYSIQRAKDTEIADGRYARGSEEFGKLSLDALLARLRKQIEDNPCEKLYVALCPTGRIVK